MTCFPICLHPGFELLLAFVESNSPVVQGNASFHWCPFFFNRWSFFCFVFSYFPQPRKVEPEPSQGSFLTLPLLVILIVLAVNHNKVRKTGTVYVFIVMMRRKIDNHAFIFCCNSFDWFQAFSGKAVQITLTATVNYCKLNLIFMSASEVDCFL